MRLSEAIRKGCEMRPVQCKGQFFGLRGEPSSCALGAAYEGVFGRAIGVPSYEAENSLFDHYQEVLRAGNGNWSPMTWEITRRNDSGESRESIADWLEAQGL